MRGVGETERGVTCHQQSAPQSTAAAYIHTLTHTALCVGDKDVAISECEEGAGLAQRRDRGVCGGAFLSLKLEWDLSMLYGPGWGGGWGVVIHRTAHSIRDCSQGQGLTTDTFRTRKSQIFWSKHICTKLFCTSRLSSPAVCFFFLEVAKGRNQKNRTKSTFFKRIQIYTEHVQISEMRGK